MSDLLIPTSVDDDPAARLASTPADDDRASRFGGTSVDADPARRFDTASVDADPAARFASTTADDDRPMAFGGTSVDADPASRFGTTSADAEPAARFGSTSVDGDAARSLALSADGDAGAALDAASGDGDPAAWAEAEEWDEAALEGVPAPRLAADVERIEGAGGMPMVYVASRRAYTRLSGLGDLVVGALARDPAPSYAQVAALVARAQGVGMAEADERLRAFLGHLYRLGVLAEPPAGYRDDAPRPEATVRLPRKPILRVPLFHPNRVVGERVARLLRARGGLPVKVLALPVLALGAYALGRLVMDPLAPLAVFKAPFLLFLPFFVLHVALHEMAHALTAAYHGVKTREFGLALLYYFIPAAYTDRTDAYRLRSWSARAHIAIAGPVYDAAAAGISSIVAMNTTGTVQAVAAALFGIQILLCVGNLNPLLPTDAYNAIEAWCGTVNFRRRAFVFSIHRLLGRPLPPFLARTTPAEADMYKTFASAVGAFILFCLLILCMGIWRRLTT